MSCMLKSPGPSNWGYLFSHYRWQGALPCVKIAKLSHHLELDLIFLAFLGSVFI